MTEMQMQIMPKARTLRRLWTAALPAARTRRHLHICTFPGRWPGRRPALPETVPPNLETSFPPSGESDHPFANFADFARGFPPAGELSAVNYADAPHAGAGSTPLALCATPYGSAQ